MDNLTAPSEHRHPILDRIRYARQVVERSGLECLDNTWKGHSGKYRFHCREGHEFLRTLRLPDPDFEMRCPRCSEDDQWGRLNQLAIDAAVRCLEPHWLGGSTPHRFECTKGHTWSRTGKRALGRIACSRCRYRTAYDRRRSVTWLRLQQVAARRGGQLLATEDAGMNHSYPFRCAAGHEWQSMGCDVMRGTWCPECARLRKVNGYRLQDGLRRLQDRAAAKGGQCLSSEYAGTKQKYRFRCAKGHEWEANGSRILRGVWCWGCSHDSKRLSLEDAHRGAQARGGQCLSTTYLGCTEKLHWLCERGHSWHAPLTAIRRGHWCPECAFMARITNPDSKAWHRYKTVPL